jgi:hypothetical protein
MNRFLKHSLFTAVAVGLIFPVHAENIDLRGKVLDQKGKAVKEAEIKLAKHNLSCLSDNSGSFQLSSDVAINPGSIKKIRDFIGIKNKVLELGNLPNASIAVFSINGALLNRIDVEKQNRLFIDELIPRSVNSQTVIISILSGDEKINLKAVKCGSQWLWNNQLKKGVNSANLKKVAVTALDTLVISKPGKATAMIPLSELVADLKNITLLDENPLYGPSVMLGGVEFSVPSKTFKDSLSFKMSTNISDAQIRYTTNGLLPTSSSTLYDGGTITITQTTQIRAAAFVNGSLSGEYSTAIYIARNFDYTSEIPIIIMDGYGKGTPKDKYNFIDLALMIFEPVNGIASISNPPTLVTRAGYHLRGQSSMMMFAQRPYRIELWDNYDQDVDLPVLGMPASSDWALISVCTDNSLIRNVFAFEIGKAIGLATVKYGWAEVFVNQTNGIVEKADYEGIYNVIQPIKNRKGTLDLKQLRPEDTDPAKLSGGYIFKFDQMVRDSFMIKLECTGAPKISGGGMWGGGGGWGGGGWGRPDTSSTPATCYDDLELVDPPEPNKQQIEWITKYIQEFHDALHAQPAGDWKKYVDMNSFVNNHVLNEVTQNVDAWIRSHFMHKDADKPITAGPVWDYNFALGNFTSNGKTGWHILDNRAGSGDWHNMMWKQPEFQSAFKSRYQELRKGNLSDAEIQKMIENLTKPLKNVAHRNFEAYPMGDCYLNSGGGGWGGGWGGVFGQTVKDSTWEGQVDSLRVWTLKRLKVLDSLVTTIN